MADHRQNLLVAAALIGAYQTKPLHRERPADCLRDLLQVRNRLVI